MHPPPRALLLLLLFSLAPGAGQMVPLHNVSVGGVAVVLGSSDNATLLAAALPDGPFTIRAGTPVGKRSLPSLTALALAPDGSRSVLGTQSGEITALDDLGGRLWSRSTGGSVTSLSAAWDNQVLYTAGNVAGVLDSNGTEIARRSLPGLRTGSLSPGGAVAMVATEGTVLGLDPATLETRWSAPLQGVTDVKAWDGGGVALGLGRNLYRLDDTGRFLEIQLASGSRRIAVSPSGQRIAVASGTGITLFDGSLKEVAKQGLVNPAALAISPEGNFLAVAAWDGNVRLFALSDRYPPAPVKIESQPQGAAITVDGAYRGITPAQIPLERGRHAIELTRDGYEAFRTPLEVAAGGERVEAALAASAAAPAPSAPSAPSATEGDDGGGLVLLILLVAGGAAFYFLWKRRGQGAPGPTPTPTPPPPPVPAAPAPIPRPGPDLPPGTSVLVKEHRPGYAYGMFRALVASGTPGLAITRRDPRRVREEVPGAEVYWLSSLPGERNLRPVDLELLLSAAEGYFFKSEGAVVLLEGMEYLQLHRGFTPVLKLVTHLQERATTRKGRLLIAVGAGVLDPRETALLKGEGRAREMEEPGGRRPSPAEITAGAVHLFLERSPEGAYRRLKEWASGGRKTLVVSRSSPEEARQRYGLGPETRTVWLTTSKGPDRVDPSDLELLLKMVRDFLEEGEDRAVLLEGVDHIAAIASFGAVQKFLGHLVDICVARRAAGLVPLDPYALEPGKVTYLGRELTVLEGGR